MSLAVTVTVDSKDLQHMLNVLPKNLERDINQAGYNYAVYAKGMLQQSLLQGDGRPLTPERSSAVNDIHARRLSRFRSEVTVSHNLMLLDSSKPHFVALTKDRRITQWAKRNYGSAVVSGRSRVWRTRFGGFTRTPGRMSNLYVTPIPFISRGLKRARDRLTPEIRSGVRKAFRSSTSSIKR